MIEQSATPNFVSEKCVVSSTYSSMLRWRPETCWSCPELRQLQAQRELDRSLYRPLLLRCGHEIREGRSAAKELKLMARRGDRNVGASTVVEGRSRVMCYFWSVRSAGARLLGWLGMQAACQRPIRGTSQGSLFFQPGQASASSGRQPYHSAAVARPASPPRITPISSTHCAAYP